MSLDLKPVTKSEFFNHVQNMDVHPRCEPMRTVWETRQRRVVGVSELGYLCRDRAGNYVADSSYFIPAGS